MLYDNVASSLHTVLTNTKSVLGRAHNHVGEQVLCCEMVASSYVCQPSQSYADFMFCLHSDVYTCPCGYRCTTQCQVRAVPPREYPTLFTGLWPYSFHKSCTVQHLSGTCCDAISHNISAILTYTSYLIHSC